MKRLDDLAKNAIVINIDSTWKSIHIADLHLGIGDKADGSIHLEHRYIDIFNDYFYSTTHCLFIHGDLYELWENKYILKIIKFHERLESIINKYKEQGRLYLIGGNHDRSMKYPEAYILKGEKFSFLCAHGHQRDLFNDKLWWVGYLVTSKLWRPIEMLGLHDPTTWKIKKREIHEKLLKNWSRKQTFRSIWGHIHKLVYTRGKYLNCGSGVGNKPEGLLIENGEVKPLFGR